MTKRLQDMNINLLVGIGSFLLSVLVAIVGGVVFHTSAISEIKETVAANYMTKSEISELISNSLQSSKDDIKKISFFVDGLQKKQHLMELHQTRNYTEMNLKLDLLIKNRGIDIKNKSKSR